MSQTEQRFHDEWLGLVQPSEGLVVSVPVLVEAQCMARLDRVVQERAARRWNISKPEGRTRASVT
jgi:hypothetical protein